MSRRPLFSDANHTRSAGVIQLLACTCLLAGLAHGAVRRVEVAERSQVAGGRAWGKSGAYERIRGTVHFGFRPGLAANRIVRDMEWAPFNSEGEVEASADFYLLRPKDLALGNGTLLFEVSNRGGKGMLNRFCFAGSASDPSSVQDFGDGWLLEQGYTLVWLGWEWDVPESRHQDLHFHAPHFRPGVPQTGLVRAEFVTDRQTNSMPLSDRGQDLIPVQKALALYVRDTPGLAPRPIAAANWKLGAGGSSVETEGGFEPGKLYEFVYQGKDPVVAGAGLAAIRDWVAFLKYGGARELSDQTQSLKRAIGFGISQSGRLLREFLYDGFNVDEVGRKVFDGVWADVAGAGRGSFNYRYAQPSRDGHPFLNIFYPTDVFPFTDGLETDPITGRTDGLLARAQRAKVQPKLFLTNDSYEYWGRAAALIHVSPDGKRDVPLLPDTRSYFIAGVQHFPRSLPLVKQGTRYLVNPVDHRPIQRALLAALQAWVAEGKLPPDSAYPRIALGELTPRAGLHFPSIPDVEPPQFPRAALRLNFGPEFAGRGIISQEPPRATGAFPILVPQVDADGMDLGGIRLPEIAVPLATITGWNLRATDRGAPKQMAEFYGSIFPFSQAKIMQRYTGKQDYLRRVNQSADQLVARRLLLPQDVAIAVEHAAKLWDALAQ